MNGREIVLVHSTGFCQIGIYRLVLLTYLERQYNVGIQFALVAAVVEGIRCCCCNCVYCVGGVAVLWEGINIV